MCGGLSPPSTPRKGLFYGTRFRCKKTCERTDTRGKASLCSGADFWHTKAIDRLNIPAAMVSDARTASAARKVLPTYGRCRKY